MGAAGGVTVYDRDEVERVFAEMWPSADITKDWWYIDTVTLTLPTGQRLLLDYADDQGNHEGTGNDFWFDTAERVTKDELPEGAPLWSLETGWGNHAGTYSASQMRVLMALHKATWKSHVEVWT